METHYHSQYDNEEFYQEAVYRFHHELYTRLLVTLDQLTLPPLDFSRHFLAMKSSVADCLAAQSNAPAEVLEEIPALLESISKVCESADLLYEKIQEINNHTVSADFPMVSGLSSKLLHIFRKMQDYFVRLDCRTQSASLMLLPVRTSVTWSRQSMHWKARTSPPHWRYSMKLIITATHFYSMKKSIITLRNIFYINQKTV